MDLSNYARVSRLLPQKIPDTDDAPLRVTPYGDQTSQPLFGNMIPMVDEGTYFYASNATAGTGLVVTITAVAYTSISPVFLLQNIDSVGGKNIYPDYVRLTLTTLAGTPGTTVGTAVEIDTINRYTSGGTAFVPYNCNTNIGSASMAKAYGGAIVSPAGGATVRRITNMPVKSVAPYVYDTITYVFGSVEKNTLQGSMALAAAGAWVVPVPPVCLGPSASMLIYLWSAAEGGTARYYEFSAGWIER